jgi:hypothetical protein
MQKQQEAAYYADAMGLHRRSRKAQTPAMHDLRMALFLLIIK